MTAATARAEARKARFIARTLLAVVVRGGERGCTYASAQKALAPFGPPLLAQALVDKAIRDGQLALSEGRVHLTVRGRAAAMYCLRPR